MIGKIRVLNNKVITIIVSTIMMAACSTENENSQITVEKEITKDQPSVQQAGILNFNSQIKEKINLAKSNENVTLKKNLRFNDIFSKGVTFTKNKGQLERFYNVKGSDLGTIEYYTRSFGGTAYFMKKGIGFGFTKGALDEQIGDEEAHHDKKNYYKSLNFNLIFENSNDNVKITSSKRQKGIINYFKGPIENHITDISSFEIITYENIYNNVDLKYYQDNDNLKYDYLVKPNGNIKDISKNYQGAKSVSLNKKGEIEN